MNYRKLEQCIWSLSIDVNLSITLVQVFENVLYVSLSKIETCWDYVSLIRNASFLHVVRALQWIIAGETFRLKVHMIDIYEVNYHTKGEFFFTFVLQFCSILTMNRVFHILWNFFQDIVDMCSAFKDLFFVAFIADKTKV